MRRILLLLLMSICASAVPADAQTTRPARDSIQMAEVEAEEEAESVDEDSVDAAEAETDTVPVPATGPYARSGGAGPFSVQASGQVAPRPERGEVVWVSTGPAPRATARDSASRDTARAGTGQRVTSGQTRRDTASAARPASRDTARTGSRVTTNQPARRDTASTTRPASRDTARTGQRVTSGQTARRDTSASTRPQNRPPARDTASAGRTNTASAGRTGASTSSGRGRAHTVVAGETFYGIARRYGVTAAQLRALNPDVDMDALEVGDELRLPAGARDSRAGAQAPRPSTPAATGGQTQQPRRGTRSHVVQSGETLFGIARRYGVTVDAIRRANEMETDQVRTGQRLVIPPAS